MRKFLIIEVKPLVSEVVFQIHDATGGIPNWVIDKYGAKLLNKRYGAGNYAVECPYNFVAKGTDNPMQIRVNISFWKSAPNEEQVRVESSQLHRIFQQIVDAWAKDLDDEDEKEREEARNRKFKSFKKPGRHLNQVPLLLMAIMHTQAVLQKMQDRYREYMQAGKLNDAYISVLDYDYVEKVYRMLFYRRFNQKEFVRLVGDGDTAAREKLPQAVWQIVADAVAPLPACVVLPAKA